MAKDQEADIVELKIPCKPEFVSVARLAMLGIASRMQLTYDQLEDVRLAVGEACTTAVSRAMKANKTNGFLTIRSEISESKLIIELEDQVPPTTTELPEPPSSPDDIDEESIGAMLMELLMDEVTVEQTPQGGTLVRMIKYAG